MNKPTKGLRFAPIIRVSTEKQADRKTSLEVQTDHIQQCVDLLNGTVIGWEYLWARARHGRF